MNVITMPVLALALIIGQEPAQIPFPVGKQTTYFTGPLDKEGYLDVEAALNDRLSQGITPDKNACVLLWKALGPTPEGGQRMPAAFFKRLGMEEPAAEGNYFISLSRYAKDHLKFDPQKCAELLDQQSIVTKRPWTAQDYPHIATWIAANEKPLALVVEAVQRPDYYSPLINRPKENQLVLLGEAWSPATQKCRELAVALAARAMFRVRARHADQAWADLLACHRLGYQVARGPTLIDSLVGNAVATIATNANLAFLERTQRTPEQLRAHLKDLSLLPSFPPCADKIALYERIIYIDMVQYLRKGGEWQELNPGAQEPRKDKWARGMIDWGVALRNGNLVFDQVAVAARIKNRAERQAELDKINKDLEANVVAWRENSVQRRWHENFPAETVGKKIGDVYLSLIFSGMRVVFNSCERQEQLRRNLTIAFALDLYHQEEKQYPHELKSLAPLYLPTIPDDLFSGKELIYRRTEKGYLLYSVGINGKDEAGHQADDELPGDDIVVQIPLPELKSKKKDVAVPDGKK